MKSTIAKREDSGANPDAVSTKTFGRHDSAAFWAARTRRQAWICGPALLKHPVDACAQLDQPRERHRFIPLGARSFPETKPDYHLLLATYPILLGRSIPRARFVDKYSFSLNTDATGDDSLWDVTPLTSHLKSRMCGLSNPGLCTKPSV